MKVREREGISLAKVAERFGIGKQTVYNWSKRLEEKGQRKRKPTKIDMDLLRKDIIENPDAYQYERAQKFGVTQMGIWHALRRLKVTYKKNPKAPQGGRTKTLFFLPEDK